MNFNLKTTKAIVTFVFAVVLVFFLWSVGIMSHWGFLIYGGLLAWALNREFSPDARVLFGYADLEGNIIIKPMFNDAHHFSEGLAAAKKNGKYGYIDKTGTFKIQPAYDEANEFRHGYAIVTRNDKKGVINKDGHTIIPTTFQEIYCHSGIFEVKQNNQWGSLDFDGRTLIETQFGSAEELFESKQYATMAEQLDSTDPYNYQEHNDKIGLKDKHGNWFIQPKYDELFYYSETNTGEVKIDKKWGLINSQGKMIVEPTYRSPGDLPQFFGDFAPIQKNGLWGAIDKEGNIVIEPTYVNSQDVPFYSEGLTVILE